MENTKSSSQAWYQKRKELWEDKNATIKEMVGWEEINLPDIKCSNELLSGLIYTKQLTPNCALDCGCGIGRVSKHVLVNYFKEIDLFEQNEKFVEKCKEELSSFPNVNSIQQCSLQFFDFKNKKYDLIWIQWCLENLEDEDLDSFISKCYNGLNDNGIVIVKENFFYPIDEGPYKDKDYNYSDEDYSKQRKDMFYINLFMKHKFKIIKHFLNPNYPSKIIPLIVYVLTK